jgi:hypothetical protein
MQIDHPYTNLTGGEWLLGNLHAHTTFSDGKRGRQEVIDDYADRGHGYLMISDHDVFTGPEEHRQLNNRGMVLIPGNEITANGPHMLHVNGSSLVTPHYDRQLAINEALAGGGFVVLNHPNWQDRFDHFTLGHMAALRGHIGMEIYNGVIGRLDGSPYATDKWDLLLSYGQKIWGFANDDSHKETGECGLGWNAVYTREKTVNGIVDALEDGRFYASTGVTINDIQVNGNVIKIKAENAERIVAYQQFAKRIKVEDSNTIEVEVPRMARYVRFECWGRGEKFAWTQPFWVNLTPEERAGK